MLVTGVSFSTISSLLRRSTRTDLSLCCSGLVWILGHVLPGWDGTNALKNPTDLFYQMCVRTAFGSWQVRLIVCFVTVSTGSPLMLSRVSNSLHRVWSGFIVFLIFAGTFFGHTHEDELSVCVTLYNPRSLSNEIANTMRH